MRYKSVSSFSIIAIFFIFFSCNLDQVENQYENYEAASKNGLFERGWISGGLISTSMEEIYLKTNLDVNTYFFSYKLSNADFDTLKKKLISIKIAQPFPHGVSIPNQFATETKSLSQFLYVEKDTVFIKVDEVNKMVYGWSK